MKASVLSYFQIRFFQALNHELHFNISRKVLFLKFDLLRDFFSR